MTVDRTENRLQPYVLPDDYIDRWVELAKWSLEKQHGPSARYSLMFALSLRRSALADKAHIRHVSHRVWQVNDTILTSDWVSLFEDDLTHRLLGLVDITSEFPTPLFPKCPCGSGKTDDWAHGLASRKLYRGHTNFQALSVEFDLPIGPAWTPQDIYMVSMCLYRHSFRLAPNDYCDLLMNQLGVSTSKNVFHNSNVFGCARSPNLGSLSMESGKIIFHPNEQQDCPVKK